MSNRTLTIITCWLVWSSLLAAGTRVLAQSNHPNTEIVVLDTGRVLTGWVTRRADTVEVRTAAGSRIVLPAKKISAICGSLDEVYQHRFSMLDGDDVQGNVSLLHWCLQHRLETQSQQQLTRLMQTGIDLRQLSYLDRRISKTFRDPLVRGEKTGQDDDVKAVKLQQVRQVAGIAEQFTPLPAIGAVLDKPTDVVVDSCVRLASHDLSFEPTIQRPIEQQEFSRKKSASISVRAKLDSITDQMSRDDLHQFQRRVQPILLKGCLAAKCHNGSDEVMPLMHRGRGQLVPKRFTQRNLQSVLSWIDGDDAAASKLLAAATSAHGNQKKPAIAPDSKQFRLVADWVEAIAANTPDLLSRAAVPGVVGADLQVQREKTPAKLAAAAAEETVPSGGTLGLQPNPAKVPQANPINASATSRTDAAVDPFDPAVFNRMTR